MDEEQQTEHPGWVSLNYAQLGDGRYVFSTVTVCDSCYNNREDWPTKPGFVERTSPGAVEGKCLFCDQRFIPDGNMTEQARVLADFGEVLLCARHLAETYPDDVYSGYFLHLLQWRVPQPRS